MAVYTKAFCQRLGLISQQSLVLQRLTEHIAQLVQEKCESIEINLAPSSY